jgi:hypothetical protein
MCSPNPYVKWQKTTTANQTLIFKVQKPIEALIYMSRSRSRVIHFCKKFWILSRDPVILMICCALKIKHISCCSLLEIPKFQSGLGAIRNAAHGYKYIESAVYIITYGNFQYLYCFNQKKFVPRMSLWTRVDKTLEKRYEICVGIQEKILKTCTESEINSLLCTYVALVPDDKLN